MFLFEGPGVGRTLHCGDFRYCSSMLQELTPRPLLDPQSLNHQALNPEPGNSNSGRIDRVYLDTTYAEVKVSFPPQQQVLYTAQQLATEVRFRYQGLLRLGLGVGVYARV